MRGDVAAGNYVMIAVSVIGVGIAPANLEKAFDSCFTTKEVGKGTGLGRSLVFGFVKQSGGHLKICSELGHGGQRVGSIGRCHDRRRPGDRARRRG